MLCKHQDPQIPSQMSFGRFFVHLAGYTFSQIEANQWKQQSKVPVFVFFWLDNFDYGIRHHMPAWHPSNTVLLVIWIGETLNLLCNNACEICHNPLLHVQWLWLVGIVARQTHHLSLKYFLNWCALGFNELAKIALHLGIQTIHLPFAAGALLQGGVVCLNGCFGVALRTSSAKLTAQLELR